MKAKTLWLISSGAVVIVQFVSEQTPMQEFYSYWFSMFAILFFYLSWIAELLLSNNKE